MRRRRIHPLAAAAGIMLLGFLIWLVSSSDSGAEEAVDSFYQYESQADFGMSWDLLHSEMKARFPVRADYVQNKSHVFLQHMDVETFSYQVGSAEKHREWRMEDGGKVHKAVYEVPVTLSFDSRFGRLEMEQSCFAVKEKGEWKLLWDYEFD